MEKVIVPMIGRYKCVILSDGKNHVFRADSGEFHEEVAERVRKKEPELKEYRVHGGGRILLGQDIIEVYGYSVDYGKMDKELVEELVSEYAKKEGLTFVNRTGEGY
jgi:hypothetical protein